MSPPRIERLEVSADGESARLLVFMALALGDVETSGAGPQVAEAEEEADYFLLEDS